MEKVWDELKKIEAQAEQIQTDAKENAKKMTQQAKQDADKLIAHGKTYAQEEGQKIYTKAVADANHTRDQQLQANQENANQLKTQAQKHMDNAVQTVVKAVLEE
ncbi:MAG: hypothetical protein NWE92_04405 [Candidatus Bathyarchaeota archaeon]|nr:hypothetical protein [Candidatus Bathyarchaeota archaeon]